MYGYQNGHPEQLTSPVDYDGELCGVGDYKDYPNLYYVVTVGGSLLSPTLDYNPVCIDKCPIDGINLIKCKATEKTAES